MAMSTDAFRQIVIWTIAHFTKNPSTKTDGEFVIFVHQWLINTERLIC